MIKNCRGAREFARNLSILLPGLFLNSQPMVYALPDGQQIIKYLNPVHEKSYLNEKQDRLIKKKNFKGIDIQGIPPVANKDIGLFAVLPMAGLKDTARINKLLEQEQINGLSCLLPWRALQPQEDKFEWQTIDELLSHCEKHNKQLILRISTCGLNQNATNSDTPEWVFKSGAKSITYKDQNGKDCFMPIFWDGTYLAKWSNFIDELGKRYDKNPALQSVGITGGGILGGTRVIPDFTGDKEALTAFCDKMTNEHGMNPRQLVSHWKYVADIFPRAFQKQHLIFDLDAPTNDRKGEDCLDEIADYIVYRYGERVYLTRENVKDDKHGFDQYRLLLKYKPDTLLGYETTPALFTEHEKISLVDELGKVTKNAFDDGLSFAEIPASVFEHENAVIKDWFTKMRLHLGYQLILQQLVLPQSLASGVPLSMQFTFINNGAASPKRPMREMDKDVASSYKLQVAIKNAEGKTLALLRHTPNQSTVDWLGNKPISWQQDLKMLPLKAGKYNLSLSIIDEQTKHKLNFVNATGKEPQVGDDVAIGTIEIK